MRQVLYMRMKHLAVLAGLLTLGTQVFAQTLPPLRIGVSDSDSPPIVVIQGSQLMAGLSRDLGLALGKAMGVPVEFVVVSRKRVEPSIETGLVDIICNSNPAWYSNPAKVGWTREFYPQIERVMSLKNNPRSIDSVDDMSGMRIGVITGYYYSAIDPLWQGKQAIRVDQQRLALLIRALQSNLVDVVVNSELEMSNWAKENPVQAAAVKLHPLVVSNMPTRCMVSPYGRYSVAKLDAGIQQMEQQGSTNRILAQYQWKSH